MERISNPNARVEEFSIGYHDYLTPDRPHPFLQIGVIYEETSTRWGLYNDPDNNVLITLMEMNDQDKRSFSEIADYLMTLPVRDEVYVLEEVQLYG